MVDRKRIAAIIILALCICAAAFAGCKKNEVKNDDKNDDTTPPAEITLNAEHISLELDETFALKVIGTDAHVEWTTKNGSVATVSADGVVTAVGAGETWIIADVEDYHELPCKVSVSLTDVGAPTVRLVGEILGEDGAYSLNLWVGEEYTVNPVLYVGSETPAGVEFTLTASDSNIVVTGHKFTANAAVNGATVEVKCTYLGKDYKTIIKISAKSVEE